MTLLPAVLRHRDYRLLVAAALTSTIGSWAFNVVLAVWVFERTGSTRWVAVATVGKFVPALILGAYGGVVAERFERVRLLLRLDVVSAAIMALCAVQVAAGGPVPGVIGCAAANAVVMTAYEPAVAALIPQLVTERDLSAANALQNTIENLVIVAGPALGALLLLVGPPSVVVVINAATFLVSAAFVSRIRARSAPVDVTESGEAGAIAQMMVGIRTIVQAPAVRVLVAFSVLATVVYGGDTVQFLLLSRDILGTGATGFGYLLAGIGLGGILAATLVTRLDRLPRLGPVLLVGMAVYCLPTLLFLVVSQPVVGFVVEVVRGAGTLVVDVLAVTALQRSVPRTVLARVYGAFGSLVIAAVALGAVLMPLVVDVTGLRASLWYAGLVLPALCLLGIPALAAADRASARRRGELEPRRSALVACDLFADASSGAAGQLAEAAVDIEVAAGQVVVRQGDEPDAFFVVLDGLLDVTADVSDGAPFPPRTLQGGDYFGEIGLIEAIPRTATVTARVPTRLLRVPGADFLAALADTAPSTALLDGASARLGRTDPARRLRLAALPASAAAEF